MRVFVFLIVSFLWSLLPARAESFLLAEGQAAARIAQGVDLFRLMKGCDPKTWEDLDLVLAMPLNQTRPDIQPALRYAFLPEPLVLPQGQGRIVVLSRSPAHDQYKMRGFFGPVTGSLPSALVRYAVIVDAEGRVGLRSFPETQIQKLFAEAQISLPPPDPLGPRPYETMNRILLGLWIAKALLISGLAGWALFYAIRKIGSLLFLRGRHAAKAAAEEKDTSPEIAPEGIPIHGPNLVEWSLNPFSR